VVDAFNYCVKEKQLQVHAWCIMSNHVHCIITSRSGALSDTVRDLKRHTAKSILSGLIEEPESRREWILFQFRKAAKEHIRNKEFQVWTHENHAVYIDPFISGMADSKLNYIHQNPVREGIVEKGEDYLYSSACDYAGKKGLIKLDKW
ncbi:MAG: transposase, partial [Flavihumibacter sp.]|nr:transposase [Flavihumibacter sp.]